MNYRIEWKQILKNKEKVQCSSDWISAESAIQLGEELERNGKVTDLYFYDEMGVSWNMKEMRKLLLEIEEEPHDITLYFDGGFQKETYQAGLGAVIFYHQGKKKYRIRANNLFNEMETNNEAEYAALYFALGILEELGVEYKTCEIKGDSQVVLKQLEGEWPCYEEVLNRWLDRIEEKINKMGIRPRYTVISRKDNKEADKLATQALEGKEIYAKTIIL
ncbi:reverse transcriptase-like protein [Neobacillus thermocopriae]|uniref:Reverse transcriptase-like protein n=1 Tax=Neobacillus thermocopriae TaxID=1215031 RepID=A0A6B3TPS6_9BACI|nr:reverse transcriptase-like protein [Neobacillus thermocopriae]MED3625058.1 reverse transcriptase-like protein [Neobacillus thermocopriae]MED3712744.1 reverse transcriptase-like protein [Neobacillus thermocopriae]NEX78985.1 reverse transcriptase-like protein [Neobacillus thermocopriae]